MNYTNDPGDVNDNREASFQKELKTEEEGGGGGG
jgi:hypothetical protein